MKLQRRIEQGHKPIKSAELLSRSEGEPHFFPLRDIPQKYWQVADEWIQSGRQLHRKIGIFALLNPERKGRLQARIQAMPRFEQELLEELGHHPESAMNFLIWAEYLPTLMPVIREQATQREGEFLSILGKDSSGRLQVNDPLLLRYYIQVWPDKRAELVTWAKDQHLVDKFVGYANELIGKKEWRALLHFLGPMMFVFPEEQQRIRGIVRPHLGEMIRKIATFTFSQDSLFDAKSYFDLCMIMGASEVGITPEGKLHFSLDTPSFPQSQPLPVRPEV